MACFGAVGEALASITSVDGTNDAFHRLILILSRGEEVAKQTAEGREKGTTKEGS